MKRQIKKIVQDTFFFGTGFGKLGYGAEFTPSPELGDTSIPLDKRHTGNVRQYKVEYRSGVIANMPWFMRTHPGNMIL